MTAEFLPVGRAKPAFAAAEPTNPQIADIAYTLVSIDIAAVAD